MVNIIEESFRGTRRSGKLWLARVVITLWDVYDEMWNYQNQVRHEHPTANSTNNHNKNMQMQLKDLI
jgi:hypothetical protein